MKKLSILFAILTIAAVSLFAQTVTLTFTGQDDANHYVRLDSVVVRNITQGWQETLFWPDTVLIVQEGTGIEDYSGTNNASKIQLSQNTPNPFTGITFADMALAEEGKVLVEVTDMAGRVVVFNNYPFLQKGLHQLRISLSTPGVYFLTARMNGNASSVKMINQREGGADKIEYQGVVEKPQALFTPKSGSKDSIANSFHLGDEIEYVGFATVNGLRRGSVHITQAQNESQTIRLTFILPHDAQPCPGTPTVTDIDGNTYNTVWIGNQCWMKENLRTTHYSDGGAIAAGNSSFSETTPYYYDYTESSLTLAQRGYLYNWPAVMHGASSSNANPSGVQGICPTGWHVPSSAEGTQLTQYIGSQSQYLCSGDSNYVAKALAATTGWNSSTTTCAVGNTPGSNNATGFSGIPAGIYDAGSFNNYRGSGIYTSFWSSTGDFYNNNAGSWGHLSYDNALVGRGGWSIKSWGFSVRCVRDSLNGDTITQVQPTITTSVVTNITDTSATLNGTVSNPDNVTITAQGFEWKVTQGGTYTAVNAMGTTMSHNLTSLASNTSYTYRAFVTTAAGTSYGGEVTFTTTGSISGDDAQPCLGTPTVTDIDGNTYNTVRIGNQCWMKENLRTTHYSDGTAIAAGNSSFSWTTPYYYDYTESSLTLAQRGYLYNWPAVMHGASSSSANPSGVQGICPTGWHLPSDAEWTQLTNYVKNHSQYVCGSNSNYIAKALAATTGWNSSTTTCAVGNTPSSNNATGFGAMPAGALSLYSSFYGSGIYACFCSSTESGSLTAYQWSLGYAYADVTRSSGYSKNHGLSVRCVRDSLNGDTITQTQPNATTFTATNITTTSATLNGTISNPDNVTITAQGFEWKVTQGGTYTAVNAMGTTMSHNLTSLASNTSYTYRAFVTTAAGTSYGGEVTFTTTASISGVDAEPCPGTLIDIDGNTYNTVWIGNQCWMKENLRTTKYADGTSIALGSIMSTITANRYYPNNDPSNVSTYGYLYNWKAVMRNSSSSSMNPSGVQGICPTGWHVPSDAEWTQLTDYVGAQSQYQCNGSSTNIAKALASTTGWETSSNTCAVGNNQSSNNVTGFNAFPAGIFGDDYYLGQYGLFGSSAFYWSSTESYSDSAWIRVLVYDYAGVLRFGDSKTSGFSVRCVRDSLDGDTTIIQIQPTVTTLTTSNITTTSATLNGTVTNPNNLTITAQGFEWKTTQGGAYTIVSATGTSISYNLTGLASNTSYTYRAFVTTVAGTNYGGELTFTTTASISGVDAEPCPGTPTVTDIDGNTYNTVWIGNQCWMKENLRTTKYADGTSIALGSTTSQITAYRYYPNNDSSNVSTYGYLYNRKAVMRNSYSSHANPSGVQGICPTGWHVPSYAEWTQLTDDYVGHQSDFQCDGSSYSYAKALASTTGWETESYYTCAVGANQSSNNATGFSAFPAGYYGGVSGFVGFGHDAFFWSSTEDGINYAWGRVLHYWSSYVHPGYISGTQGCSVRCVRD